MKTIIFDTETTDLKPGRICQLTYVIINEGHSIGKNFFFSVDYVSPSAEAVHGFSVKQLEKLSEGRRFFSFAQEIYNDFCHAAIVGHNVDFDISFMKEEMDNAGFEFAYVCKIDTMKEFAPYCQLPHYKYAYKFPKLTELMGCLDISKEEIEKTAVTLFGQQGQGFHDARYDVAATTLAYYKRQALLEKVDDC
jgi:DNA polymerase-3 subunit epsilon